MLSKTGGTSPLLYSHHELHKSPSPATPDVRGPRAVGAHGPTPSPDPRRFYSNNLRPATLDHGMRGAAAAPSPRSFLPPPPLRRAGTGKPNIFDEDANAEVVTPLRKLDCAVAGTPSPLPENAFANEPAFRPVSAAYRPSTALTPSHLLYRGRQPRTSSAVNAPPLRRPKKVFSHMCRVVVEEEDPTTRSVMARYECGAHLGMGGYGHVYEFTDLATGEVYACKVIDRSKLKKDEDIYQVRQEISIHRRLQHPNIVRMVKSFWDDNYIFILLELCDKHDLMQVSNERGPFSIPEIRHIMTQLSRAIQYIHEQGIIHRDVKLGNVMVGYNGDMKIGDFGFASVLVESEKKIRMCGTPNYMAPEVIMCRETKIPYGMEVDIWSLGVLLYILAFGQPPFHSKDIDSTYDRIRRMDYRFPSSRAHAVPEECKTLIRWMLERKPEERPTPSQILASHFLRDPSPHVPRSLIPQRPPGVPAVEAAASPIDYKSPDARTPSVGERNALAYAAEGRKTLAEFLYENDASSSALLDRNHRVTGTLPPLPAAFIGSSVFYSKYGYGFCLCTGERTMPAVCLNDRTKLVYDKSSDTAYFYARVQEGARTFVDYLHSFDEASASLCPEKGPEDYVVDPVLRSAQKSYAITTFLARHLADDPHPDFPRVRGSFRGQKLMHSHELFTMQPPAAMEAEGKGAVYVKEAVIESVLSDYMDVNMTVMAARLSNSSYQVTVHCTTPCPAELLPTAESRIISRGAAWTFDLLVYNGANALFAVETEHTLLYQTVEDIKTDVKTREDGRTFFAVGSSTSNRQLTIPHKLLRPITELLRKVRCPSAVVDCFC